MKIITLIITVLLPFYAFGDSQAIKSKSLNFVVNNDYESRLDEQEKEIQRLLGKIEILEHKIGIITNQSNIIKSDESINQAAEVDSAPDVFDVSTLEEINNSPNSQIPVESKKNVEITDKQAYDLALASFKDGNFAEAEKKFAAFINTYPKSAVISNAYFWYGESFFKRKDFNKAAINYLKCYKESQKGPKSSDALLKLSLSLGELKKTQEACNILVKLDKEFPTNRSATSKKMAEDAKVKFGCKNKQSK
ncbi:tol-pal system protein YbgF [Rickettsia endosymbiont of Halotydeus destructor]|uniref:tol-pal system protein YbgF n=1 Tax=Rickettsia endosymbiont of Halotydeus destructor TaxID=2996754 RepID=UPI003BB09C25